MKQLHKLSIARVIAHRGASGYAPENTMSALHKAVALDAKWIEFDVMLTQDLQPIIIHDIKLDRTTNGRGEVAKTKLAKIRELDAGSWFGPNFKDEKVPTFAEYLMAADAAHIGINVEIKPTPGTEVETARIVLQTLQHLWPKHAKTSLVSSASLLALRTVRALDEKISVGLIVDAWEPWWQEILDELNSISLHINHEQLTPVRVAAVMKTGRAVLAYTVNDPERAAELFSWGVTAVFTDFPDRILPIVH